MYRFTYVLLIWTRKVGECVYLIQNIYTLTILVVLKIKDMGKKEKENRQKEK